MDEVEGHGGLFDGISDEEDTLVTEIDRLVRGGDRRSRAEDTTNGTSGGPA
jgi:hypothetical protein